MYLSFSTIVIELNNDKNSDPQDLHEEEDSVSDSSTTTDDEQNKEKEKEKKTTTETIFPWKKKKKKDTSSQIFSDDTSFLKILFHLRGAPYTTKVIRIKYDWETKTGKRNWLFSGLLAFGLILIALFLGSLFHISDFNTIKPDLCQESEFKLNNYSKTAENKVKIDEAETFVIALEYEVEESYNCSSDDSTVRDKWPEVYEMDEETRREFELAAQKKCKKTVCKDIIALWDLWEECYTIEYECPDPGAVNFLGEYDRQQSQGYAMPKNPVNPSFNVTQDESNKIIEQLEKLFSRINYASSAYVIYLSLNIFFGPALIIVKTSFFSKLQLGGLSKVQWIFIIIFIWYAYEALTVTINTPEFKTFWYYFETEPCMVSSSFVNDFYSNTGNICYNLDVLSNRYNHTIQNYKYYRSVDKTYSLLHPDKKTCWVDGWEDSILPFDYSCSTQALIKDMLQEKPKEIDYLEFFTKTGLLASLFLQPIVAHLFLLIFSVIAPLSPIAGRIIIPIHDFYVFLKSQAKKLDNEKDEEKKQDLILKAFEDKIEKFLRYKAILPLCIVLGGFITLLALIG
ncbi:32 kda heat shock protein [Anaeramoeba flamelloides]|uniref:32 kDa heat shock protein n=1 Tax=Anaeramoeba flamelloides TaxID=1746091 RepID=A0AAV7YJD1_9EUKA|nr:32 kda heat shock protein [Anaeramoeba flamelloides]